MRANANEIAVRAIQNILGAAHPFEVEIEGTKVTCTPSLRAQEPWPKIRGLPETGVWPRAANITCKWEGGVCVLRLEGAIWRGGKYDQDVALRIRLDERTQELVFRNFGTPIGKQEEDGPWRVKIDLSCKKPISIEMSRRISDSLKTLLGKSTVPPFDSGAEGCIIDVPSGEVTPSPEKAFERLVHIALLKLDFIDFDERAKDRGTPLIDVTKWGIDKTVITAPTGGSTGVDPVDTEEEEAPAAAKPEIPQNLILYGPPGTGKTFTLRDHYFPSFTRTADERAPSEVLAEQLEDLYWYQVIALALDEIGKAAKLDEIVKHRYVQAHLLNNQAKKSSLPAMLSTNLGSHTVETCEAVKVKRYGEALFDKDTDGAWKLADGLPEDLAEAKKEMAAVKRSGPATDYTFITFPQS